MSRRALNRRSTVKTLLLVGEGETEVAFLTHLKALCAPRWCGLYVKVICAHGKGAKHVVDVAIRQSRNAAFDSVAALLDTDTDWNDQVQRRATEHCILLLLSRPCVEAMLLRALGRSATGRTRDLKKRLKQLVQDPMDSHSYATLFDEHALNVARRNERVIEDLLRLFGR
ncbi:RloB domain-containing protein [Thiomonas sp.]|jgi:hypothetical protein|uniref:RloB domain-containing protein n=1 Tax=Thiomonas sp. TaxID=2047785 RepID=UPI0025829FE1|nr:RloB domain-containing protein [Thiomonas sp.]